MPPFAPLHGSSKGPSADFFAAAVVTNEAIDVPASAAVAAAPCKNDLLFMN
jgi:hypothetical protein